MNTKKTEILSPRPNLDFLIGDRGETIRMFENMPIMFEASLPTRRKQFGYALASSPIGEREYFSNPSFLATFPSNRGLKKFKEGKICLRKTIFLFDTQNFFFHFPNYGATALLLQRTSPPISDAFLPNEGFMYEHIEILKQQQRAA